MDRAHVGFAVCDPGLSFGAIVGLGAKERAAELGVDFSMVSVFTPHQQAAAIERFTATGVDALIVEAVESQIVVPAIERADAAGIPVIVADHPLHSVETVCAVRSDNVKGGELAARYLVDRLHGEGVVAHLQGLPTSDTGLDRSRGFHDVVDRHAGIRIVEAGSEWTSDAGAAAMRELLAREPGVHAVFANNDPLALGAVEAVDEAGRTGDIVVAGYDALPDALLAIGDGRMAATIRQRPHAMGRLALEMAVRVHSGDRVPPVVETGVSLVTAHNVAEASLDTLPLFSRLLRDLTESHEALSEERTLLRTLIDNLPDLIYVKDDASRFMVVNSAGLRHLGAASETEVIGRTDFDFFPAEFAAHYRADEQALVRAGEPLINREEATPDSHGRTHWVSTTKVPIRDTSGRIVGLVGMSRDITARKLAEAEQARLATEQAALRRVATLVAGAASPDAVFAAVAEEAGRLLRADGAFVIRYDADETATVVAAWSAAGERVAGALHQPLSGAHDLSALVREIGLRARADDSSAGLAALDIRSTIEAPVTVDRRLWGVMLVASADEDALDGRSEGRLADFTDLVATAIANAEARDELERSRAESRRTAAEQAALRRIATLVARGVRASEIFDALTRETKGILEADASELLRIESDGGVTVVAADHALALLPGVGRRFMPAPGGAIARVLGTGRPARFERDPVSAGRQDEQVSPVGMTGAVAAPVVVNGRVWGVMSVSWAEPRSMPPYPEGRLVQFTELLATAIANADSRDQLAASRARLVTEADAARRRVVRDLHDGAQQRLIHAAMTLGLAERALELGDGTAQPLIAEAMEHMQRANKELRELSHGILPADLTGGGLRGGVDAIVERLDLDVKVDLPAERLPAEIEVSAYFIVAEALTNTVKHAHAQSAEVSAWVNDRTLQIEIRDDGVGGADSGGHGLIGINDRVTALGGHLSVESPVGGGTLIAATLPIALERPDAARPPAIRNSEHVRQATGGSERDR